MCEFTAVALKLQCNGVTSVYVANGQAATANKIQDYWVLPVAYFLIYISFPCL
jgi:hypothetical protein